MLCAVGNVVHQIQEVTGIGKGDSDKQQDKDIQQEVDQAPAGVEDESSPEFTTTKKETQPSGESVVKETQDDVPVPQDDTPSADTNSTSLPAPADLAPAETKPEPSTTDAEPAAQSKTTPQPADTQSKPQQASPAAADSEYVPSDKPMNQLRNMGGGSTPQPKTPKSGRASQAAGSLMHLASSAHLASSSTRGATPPGSRPQHYNVLEEVQDDQCGVLQQQAYQYCLWSLSFRPAVLLTACLCRVWALQC